MSLWGAGSRESKAHPVLPFPAGLFSSQHTSPGLASAHPNQHDKVLLFTGIYSLIILFIHSSIHWLVDPLI
jgi:hypothetical protein